MTFKLPVLVISFCFTLAKQASTDLMVDTNDIPYLELLSEGVCRVKCLNQTGQVQLPELDDDNEIFIKSVSCLSPSCNDCFQNSTCSSQARRQFYNDTKMGGISILKDQKDDPMTLRPIFHCSTFLKGNSTFDVYFRLEFSHNITLGNLTMERPDDIPRMFLVRTEFQLDQEWKAERSVLTVSWFPSVNVPENVTFRLHVTPITTNGIYSPIYSESIKLSQNVERGVSRRPKDLKIHRIRQNPFVTSHPDLQVLLHWKSGMGHDATCAGQIWVLDKNADAYDFSHANEAFWFNLTNQTKGACLSFDKNYSIHVTESSDLSSDVSDSAEIAFRLPPCLQFFDNNFTMCAPPPPRDLRFTTKSNNEILASWLPPNFTTSANQIEAYELRLIKFNPQYPTKSSSMPTTGLHQPIQLANVTVSGSTTSVLFRNVTNSGLLQVFIRAYSKGGVSPAIFEGPHPTLNMQDSVIDKIVMASIVFFMVCAFVIIIAVLKIKRAKQERRRVRAKYFGDDNKDIADMLECSYFPMYCSKWLIETNCLKIGELIGEGNFGQVHAATLYKSQSSRIVAVKTLKEGVNLSEKSKFWEEFQILKNLEPHPNLVRLIGIVKAYYPTLVVEYCDGGDLHSYLRNLRDEKIKRLAREKRRLKWMSSGTISGEFLRNSNPNNPSDDLALRYTNNVPTAENLNLSVVTNDAYFYSRDTWTKPNETGILDPVELNLFVSFGRQVAVGMEFLANNKIVHRDLAARNILVMHESKPVLKIADFGLSRDVYEKNWYKKNSDDKIPFKWLALECLLDEVYTTKSDVWSFGVLLWEIVTYGGSPYPGIKNVEIFEFLKKGFRMSQPDGCPPELYVIMRKCWEKEAEDRPDFATLRHLLDTMMENSDSVDYFQLLENHWPACRESQGSTDETLEADIKYSTIAPLNTNDHSSPTENNNSNFSSNPITFTENLLYASILGSSLNSEPPNSPNLIGCKATLIQDTGCQYRNTAPKESSYENRFSMSLNEMNRKSREYPFEFEIIRKELLISAPEKPISGSDNKQMCFLSTENGRNQTSFPSIGGRKSAAFV